MDLDDKVAVYAKLPRGFQIPTPVGNYAPDWAICFKKGTDIFSLLQKQKAQWILCKYVLLNRLKLIVQRNYLKICPRKMWSTMKWILMKNYLA